MRKRIVNAFLRFFYFCGKYTKYMTFSIEYKTVWGESLELVMGRKRFPMNWTPGDVWRVEIPRCTQSMLDSYAYEVIREGHAVRREWMEHHAVLRKGMDELRDSWIDTPEDANPFLRRHSCRKFDMKGWRGAGTAVPVFSLRSEKGFGVGEFEDLKLVVDWAEKTGQSIIQLLPINDTTMSGTWMDSYPYNANSSFALHPQFLRLTDMGIKEDSAFKKMRAELNAQPKLDYVAVNEAKNALTRAHYASAGKADLASEEFRLFFGENKEWLLPYSVYCALRDEHSNVDFASWGECARYSAKKAKEYYAAHKEEVEYHFYIQYHLDRQLKGVVDYAHKKGVYFKGDLPIGVSRTSADAWCNPKLFNLDSQAGAPPDPFSEDGQNWGFPTYNWDVMAKDGYAWWKARLGKMAEYFDLFRIDHLLGFFRIWEIPVPEKSGMKGHFSPALPYSSSDLDRFGLPAAEGLFLPDPRVKDMWHPGIGAKKSEAYDGLTDQQKLTFDWLYEDFFYHRHNEFWKERAMRKLPDLLAATGMLACGEDLGMIPACVPEVMDDLKLLSLEIQRMPKVLGQIFAVPAEYPYLSVCTTSTHDMSPLRMWWEEEDRELIQKYYEEVLELDGDAPEAATTEICEQIIGQHLASPAMLTVLPLQDWLAIDAELRAEDPMGERINIPAIPRHYWRYRMHLTLEKLVYGADEFNAKLKEMITESDR